MKTTHTSLSNDLVLCAGIMVRVHLSEPASLLYHQAGPPKPNLFNIEIYCIKGIYINHE